LPPLKSYPKKYYYIYNIESIIFGFTLSNNTNKPYPDVTPQASYPQIEERVLAYWNKEKTFQQSIDNRDAGKNGANEFVFYDGPPFANGLPHHGHLLTGYVKDIIPRYQTMRGKKVERRFGWDCHGLPAEMLAEKELSISGQQQIQEFGIDKFNDHCRSSVLRYTQEWESYVTRQARWVDFKNDYKTMDLPYMESVMWAFKQLWDKGLVYEGFRVMPYSWACETPLSNFEIRLDNSYRPRQDPAITVAFPLLKQSGDTAAMKLLVWTTTPWTLPSNLAVAVGADIEYSLMQDGNTQYVIGSAVLKKYEAQLKNFKQVGTIKGKDLVGRQYEPLFPYFRSHPNAFRVLAGDFVNTDEGTGIVHMAPGFGEDDQKLCEANNISTVCPVDNAGRFTAEIPEFQGQNVLESNKEVIRVLKDRGVVLLHETYTHNYPHCWRTDTPLIYKAVSSWYVKVTAFKDRMVELNKSINWIPNHIRDGSFGKWLENARDWSISRNRFWGAPIPVWKSDDPKYPRIDAYGSIDELERDFGVRPKDLHRPYIDQLTRPNPDDPTGKSTMRRVDVVFDCWFESGSMPFAQVHYPFENKDWFEHHFPADFIVEYIAQTRGWFYTMMVLATALFERPPFRNCICHGVVLDANGQKLSKRLRNYISPEEVAKLHGLDALRWFMVSSPILKGLDLHIDKEGKAIAETVRTILNPIWNAYYFFTLYANSDEVQAKFSTTSDVLLDRYILSKTRQLIEQVTSALDSYEIADACSAVTSFLDAFNNWYIRRSRERFWKQEKDADKMVAYDTLYTVLVTLCRLCAPLLPMITEEIYRGLTSERSIHLGDWPDSSQFPDDKQLVQIMDKIREVCSAGLSIRETHELRTRLPLAAITIAGNNLSHLEKYSALIKEELNIKAVHVSDEINNFASYQLHVNARELGPRMGPVMKDVIAASKKGDWKLLSDGLVEVAGHKLSGSEFTLRLNPKEGLAAQALPKNDAVVVIDINVTKELEEEGLARDLVRLVQQARKEAGLHVADQINLGLDIPSPLVFALEKHKAYISEQTLAKELVFGKSNSFGFSQEQVLGGENIRLSISKS
jgi:isoleucyl-tRNA synthetase